MNFLTCRSLFLILLLGACVQAETIQVYLIGGQSNALGHARAADLPAGWRSPQPDVFYNFNQTTGPLAPRETFGPEVSFGRSMADFYKPQGKKVALLHFAVGATDLFDDWYPDGTGTTADDGEIYRRFQKSIAFGMRALKKANPSATIVMAGMLWMQGESDALANRKDYAVNLSRFITDIRLTYGATLPFFIGQLSLNQTAIPPTALEMIRKAQADVAATIPRVHLINTDALPVMMDRIHFNTTGQITLGLAFAQAARQTGL